MIEGHGDDAWKYDVAIRADFSSNVRYGSLDPGVAAHLREKVAAITHYPEAGASTLQALAAEVYGVGREQVLVTNGATEGIYLIAQAFRGGKATIYIPSFAEYEDACRIHGIELAFRDWEELRTGNLPDAGLVFLCNPNNPTGAAVALEKLGEYPNALFVVDESYIEFTGAVTSVLAKNLPNVLVLRSLTKACKIPGLRIGFVLGEGKLIDRLRACKMPWSVNRLALEAGSYIFCHRQDFVVPVERLRAETEVWRGELEAATGWKVYNTDTHYFLIETPAPLKMHLLSRYGLLVRDASNFRGLGPNFIRVATQTPEHNQLLTEALQECVRTGR
jgi:threonine-phosphate decarboxylase